MNAGTLVPPYTVTLRDGVLKVYEQLDGPPDVS